MYVCLHDIISAIHAQLSWFVIVCNTNAGSRAALPASDALHLKAGDMLSATLERDEMPPERAPT